MAIKFLSAIDLGGLELINSKPQFVVGANLINTGTPQAGELLASQHEGRIVYDSTANVIKFSDGSVWLDVSGDIRSITAGAGLTGDATSGDVTLAVGAGTGITVNANDVALDTSHTRNVAHSSVDLTAGSGLTGGGDITTSRTFAVGAGTGISVNADDVQIRNAGNFSNNTLLKWTTGDSQFVNSSITDDGTTVTIGANLTVTGTTTYVNSNTVEIGDSIILLNADATGSASEDAGFEVERGDDANVKFIWDESEDYFSTVDKPLHVGTVDTITPAGDDFFYMYENATGETGIIKKANVNTVADLMGAAKWFTLDPSQDSVTKTGNAYTITHDYNTQKIMVQIVDSSTFETVHVDVTRPSVTTVKVTFANTVTNGDYIAILNAAKLNGDTLAYEGLTQSP